MHTLLYSMQSAEELFMNTTDKLDTVGEKILHLRYGQQNRKIEPAKPYECEDTSFGKLFCEDKRYGKHLLLIGRGHMVVTHDLYQKFLTGIPCNKKCIDSDTDFFIGTNNCLQLVREKSFDVLFVYFDADDMEHFRYISKFQFDGKMLNITRSRSSMTEVSLKEFVKNITVKSWKIFLRKKVK